LVSVPTQIDGNLGPVAGNPGKLPEVAAIPVAVVSYRTQSGSGRSWRGPDCAAALATRGLRSA